MQKVTDVDNTGIRVSLEPRGPSADRPQSSASLLNLVAWQFAEKLQNFLCSAQRFPALASSLWDLPEAEDRLWLPGLGSGLELADTLTVSAS